MSNLYISEYSDVGHLPGLIPAAAEPAITDQLVNFAGASVQSNAFKNNTQVIRVHTDSICSIAFGANPTATTSNKRLVAGQTEYFTIGSYSNFKIAVIANT